MEGLSKMLLLALQRSNLAECLEKGILFNKDKPNLVDGRNSESNRRKFKYMEDNRSDEGEWGNNRIQHYSHCMDRRGRLGEPWTK